MSRMVWRRLAVVALSCSALALIPLGCGGDGDIQVAAQIATVATPQGGGISTAGLALKVLTSYCPTNMAGQVLQVTNTGTTALKLSDISFRYWVNDTTSQTIVPHVNSGGCASNANGVCSHSVQHVTPTATRFSPATGPDPRHQANWEIAIANTDTASLPAGATWGNIQTSINLDNFAAFVPGSGTWFSPCLAGNTYAEDTHFAVYYKGDLVYSTGITAPAGRGPKGGQQLAGYVTSEIAATPLVGPAAQDTLVDLWVGIPVRDRQGLRNYISQISTPSSPLYGQSLTPAQFQATYSPPQSDYDQVVQWSHAKNLTVVKTDPNRTRVRLRGTVADVEKAFFVNLDLRTRSDGTQFYALDREPSVDVGVTLLRVSGLENFDRTIPQDVPNPLVRNGPGATPTLWGNDFRQTYLTDPSQPGAQHCLAEDAGHHPLLGGLGQSIGVWGTTETFDTNDMVRYRNQSGMSPGNDPIDKCASDGPCPTLVPGNAAVELTLDIELASSMAPDAQIVVFRAANGGVAGTNDILHEMAIYNLTNPPIFQFTSSYGMAVDDNSLAIFEIMAVQRQSFFLASGDTGAIDFAGFTGARALTMPVTAVGMTRLRPLFGGILTREDPEPFSTGGVLSGPIGALLPDYQASLTFAAFGGSATFRNVPDVTMVGTDITVIINSLPGSFSGTSLSSPLWAGFLALANQRRLENGLAPVGFANPAFYAIGATRGAAPNLYATSFNDVVNSGGQGIFGCTILHVVQEGLRCLDQSPAVVHAPVGGYDLASGWGSPQCGLVDTLAGNGVVGTCANPVNQCAWSWPDGFSCGGVGGCDLNTGCCTLTPPVTCPVINELVLPHGTPTSGCDAPGIVRNVQLVSWSDTTCFYEGDAFNITPCGPHPEDPVGPSNFTRPRMRTCLASANRQCIPNADGGGSCQVGSCDVATGCCPAACVEPSLRCTYDAAGNGSCGNGDICNPATGCCPPPVCPTRALQCQLDVNGNPSCPNGQPCDGATGCCGTPVCPLIALGAPGASQCSLDAAGNANCGGLCDSAGCCEPPFCPTRPLQCRFDSTHGATCGAGACDVGTGCCPLPACTLAGTQCATDATGQLLECPGGGVCDVASGCCTPATCPTAELQCGFNAGGASCSTGACNLATGCCPEPVCLSGGGLKTCPVDSAGNVACPGGEACDQVTGCCNIPTCPVAAEQCPTDVVDGHLHLLTCAGSVCDVNTGCCLVASCPELDDITLGIAPFPASGGSFIETIRKNGGSGSSCSYIGERWDIEVFGGSQSNVDMGPVEITCSRRANANGKVECTFDNTPAVAYCDVGSSSCCVPGAGC